MEVGVHIFAMILMCAYIFHLVTFLFLASFLQEDLKTFRVQYFIHIVYKSYLLFKSIEIPCGQLDTNVT